MADTSKAPERIWTCDECRDIYITEAQEDTTPYVRADLYDAAQAVVARLTAALTEAETRGWQPIETAPDAGSDEPILVWDGYSMHVAWFGWREAGQRIWFNGDVRVDATRWMPLPLPPRERDGQEGGK